MGLLRGLGYFVAILILIGGIIALPWGIVGIGLAIVMMWLLHKGGQVTAMKKDIQRLRQIEEENHKLEIDKRTADALRHNKDLQDERKTGDLVN